MHAPTSSIGSDQCDSTVKIDGKVQSSVQVILRLAGVREGDFFESHHWRRQPATIRELESIHWIWKGLGGEPSFDHLVDNLLLGLCLFHLKKVVQAQRVE